MQITIMDNNPLTYKTDWLGSKPVYYNTVTGSASHDIWQVIDMASLDFHPEGLANYLKFGYSVLGQTPVKNVRFLNPLSEITIGNGSIADIKTHKDPVPDLLHLPSNPHDVITAVKKDINDWEKTISGPIILPLSGGLDSRLLLWCLKDKERVRAFTYGGAPKQELSHEVVYASEIARRQGINWEHIKLGHYHNSIDRWIEWFGPAVHAHGMYQMEFYDLLIEKGLSGKNLLSGIIGDIWAGNLTVNEISSPNELINLGYTHGLHADPYYSILKHNNELVSEYFENNKYLLKDPIYRIVASMRLKIMLLRYLITVPENMGFVPWTPFLKMENAVAMLNLPCEQRKDRKWQRDFFKSQGLNIETAGLKYTYANTLNSQALKLIPVKPLDTGLLSEIIQPGYIKWINKHLTQKTTFWELYHKIMVTPRLKGVAQMAGCKNIKAEAYAAYLTLKPLETLIKKRNEL